MLLVQNEFTKSIFKIINEYIELPLKPIVQEEAPSGPPKRRSTLFDLFKTKSDTNLTETSNESNKNISGVKKEFSVLLQQLINVRLSVIN